MDPIPVASTSTGVARPQSKVKAKNKLTAKQKERNKVKAQTPEEKKDNAQKKLLATRLRCSISYNQPETNVILEGSRTRGATQSSGVKVNSTAPLQDDKVENAESSLGASTSNNIRDPPLNVAKTRKLNKKQKKKESELTHRLLKKGKTLWITK